MIIICKIVKIINKIVSTKDASCVNVIISKFRRKETKDGIIIEKNANPQEIVPKVNMSTFGLLYLISR